MKDELVKALVCGERVRVIVDSTTNLCEDMIAGQQRQQLWDEY